MDTCSATRPIIKTVGTASAPKSRYRYLKICKIRILSKSNEPSKSSWFALRDRDRRCRPRTTPIITFHSQKGKRKFFFFKPAASATNIAKSGAEATADDEDDCLTSIDYTKERKIERKKPKRLCKSIDNLRIRKRWWPNWFAWSSKTNKNKKRNYNSINANYIQSVFTSSLISLISISMHRHCSMATLILKEKKNFDSIKYIKKTMCLRIDIEISSR